MRGMLTITTCVVLGCSLSRVDVDVAPALPAVTWAEPVAGSMKVGDQRLVRMRGSRERLDGEGKAVSKTPMSTDVLIKVVEAGAACHLGRV